MDIEMPQDFSRGISKDFFSWTTTTELFANGVVTGHEVTQRYLTKLRLFLCAQVGRLRATCAEATA